MIAENAYYFIFAASVLAFCFGLWLGQKSEANIWRLKGDPDYRTANYSGGKFWYVMPEHEFNEMNLAALAYGRLPDGMKDCTISFEQCEKGHGWLTAANWVKRGCQTCREDAQAAFIVSLRDHGYEHKDYACTQCVGEGAIGDGTFVCVYHRALAAMRKDGPKS